MEVSPIRAKSYRFALDVIGLYRELQVQREYVLSRQLLRAGTSIGANVEEARAAQSRRDFLSKMAVASKEARESRYWLRLLRDSQLVDKGRIRPLILSADELIKILTAIVKTTGANDTGASQLKTQNSKLKT